MIKVRPDSIRHARDADGALAAAISIGFPVVVLPDFAEVSGEGMPATWMTLAGIVEYSLSISWRGEVAIGKPE